jgi:Bacterial PH domain/Short C-terminal domain
MANHPWMVRSAEKHLESGEQILDWVLGVYEVDRLLLGNGSRSAALIATDRRILFFAKKLVGYDLESFPYRNISSFEQEREVLGAYLRMFAAGNTVELKWIQDRRGLAAFMQTVKEHMSGAVAPSAAPAARPRPSDIPERIRELARLRDEGLLTEQEYARKKAELLARL